MAKISFGRFSRVMVAGIGLLLIIAGFVFVADRTPTLQLGGEALRYERADTPAKQQQGLSDRADLPQDQAMLFIFKADAQDCFWMKDMRFSLDMIWLNNEKKVVYIKSDATPESYPERFCPDRPARYVIEVNAGVVQRTNLKLGDQVQF